MKGRFMRNAFLSICIFSPILLFSFFQMDCSNKEKKIEMTKEDHIAKGKYIVLVGGCGDCHSPKIMTQMGPIPDTTRLLSGHQANEPIGKFDSKLTAPGKWLLVNQDLTAWAGPWGISFTANITPDSSTGIGAWSENDFINTMRSGKHLGNGRHILPPMPWEALAQFNDDDLKDIFAYLQSIPPIKNKVPNPIIPNMK
jgi:mono/diheme cytochrome c family protein